MRRQLRNSLENIHSLQTSGRSVSDTTFGDVGIGLFGELTFETINFNSTKYHDRSMVKANQSI